jgi:predicted DNA-binding transcriptional regulator YafY
LRAVLASLDVANDGAREDAATLRLGARLLALEAAPSIAATATRILDRLDDPIEVPRMPTRTVTDNALRAMVACAVTERRILSFVYWSHDAGECSVREVEALSLSHVDGHWTLLAFCRTRGDMRSFRFDRVVEARLTDLHFDPHRGLSLERFIHRQKNLTHTRHAVAR